MTGRRKGTPCACETDPCSCGSSKGKCVRAVNNVSPDPNGDLVIRGGTGIEIVQSGDDLVINNTANPNAFVAGNNIELNPSGDDIAIDLTQDPVINGTLTVNGDIIQNGAAYETHAEKIYTRDDYIIMRDGAIAALAPGDYAGFQVKLYDGVNDGRLVIDNSGTARVGDAGDEEPLLTRDESGDLTDGALFKWDAANFKAVNEGTVGDDTHPIKIVNGVATPVSKAVADYTPLLINVQNDLLGDIIQCVGRLTYQRVAYKKGLLSGSLRIGTNNDPNYTITNLTKIGSVLGLSLLTPAADQSTGQWITSDKSGLNGYGTCVYVKTDGTIELGRLYNSTSYGSWPLSSFSEACIIFQNVELTEA